MTAINLSCTANWREFSTSKIHYNTFWCSGWSSTEYFMSFRSSHYSKNLRMTCEMTGIPDVWPFQHLCHSRRFRQYTERNWGANNLLCLHVTQINIWGMSIHPLNFISFQIFRVRLKPLSDFFTQVGLVSKVEIFLDFFRRRT